MEKHTLITRIKSFFKDGIIRLWDKYHRYPRYFVVIPCEVTSIKHDISFEARIVNISKSGIFLETKHEIEEDSNLSIKFRYLDIEYIFTAHPIDKHAVIHSNGVGAKFLYDHFYEYQREVVSDLIKVLESQIPPIPKA